MSNVLRNIPSVNELLESPQLTRVVERVNRSVAVSGVRTFLDKFRQEVQSAAAEMALPSPAELAERIAKWILHEDRERLRPVINATGILLHTGLGRAPLAREALDAITATAAGYASLEVDLETGQRSQRADAVESQLRRLTGAEAAAVVNNNAAATLLTLTAVAADREVIVSRGQLVEIGGSFRLPEVMQASGARLREVGATNKTRISDYSEAITAETAALMRVHTSNYRIVGFTAEPSLDELIALSRKRHLPVIDDIGSGALFDFGRWGIEGEPVAAESIKAGADLVLFSGDKLLGGPQCGLIVGKREWVKKITSHPMMRAMRVDKMTFAALSATLRLYQDDETARRRVPLLALLDTPEENLRQRALRLAPQMEAADRIAAAEAVADDAFLGGGTVPAQRIATWCVALTPEGRSVDRLAEELRIGSTSVFGRVHRDRLLLDLRSVFPGQDAALVEAVAQSGTDDPAVSAEGEGQSEEGAPFTPPKGGGDGGGEPA